VTVTAAAHQVVDRRRTELVEPGTTTAPIHYEGADPPRGRVARRRRAGPDRPGARVGVRTASAELDRLAADLSGRIVSMSLRPLAGALPVGGAP